MFTVSCNAVVLRIFWILVAMLAIQGCAYRMGGKHSGLDVLPHLSDSKGRVVLYRDRRWSGALIRPAVYVDGESVGRSTPGGFFYIDKPVGTYLVKCSSSELTLTVEPGKIYFVEMVPWANPGDFYEIRLVSVIGEQARPIINTLVYTGEKQ